MRSPMLGKYLDGTYSARGASVADLVEYLRRHSLEFAPAVHGQEKDYLALYRELDAYRARLGTPR